MLKILQKDAPNESIGKLANSFGITYKYFLEPFSFSSLQFVKQIRKLNEIYAGRLLGYCDYIASLEGNSHPKSFATSLVQSNTLGPIIFSTPELGRWSTAGGLGVMVDELS